MTAATQGAEQSGRKTSFDMTEDKPEDQINKVAEFNPVTDELGGMLSGKNSDLPNPVKQSKRTAGSKKAKKLVQQPPLKQRPGEKMLAHEYGKYLDGSQDIQMKRSSQS